MDKQKQKDESIEIEVAQCKKCGAFVGVKELAEHKCQQELFTKGRPFKIRL